MNEVVGIGVDLDDVVQRAAASPGGQLVERPALHVRLPLDGVKAPRMRTLDLPAAFTHAALALADADACGLVQLDVHDTYALWRQAAVRDPTRADTDILRRHLRGLLEGLGADRRARIAVAIPDPAEEAAQERWLRALSGLGRVDPVWRPVLAALGFLARPRGALPSSFTLLVVEVGWRVLRANVLKVEHDAESGLYVPERQRPGEEVTWDGPALPDPKRHVALAWTRQPDGVLVPADAAPAALPPELAAGMARPAGELGERLRERVVGATAPVVWLVEGALAGASCGPERLGDAVVRGLRRVLPAPDAVELCGAAEGLVARGGAECARRLARELPAWWDALPQLEINREERDGRVDFVPLVTGSRWKGGATYTNVVTGFKFRAGARELEFVLMHEYHSTARRLRQHLKQELPEDVEVQLLVWQKPAQGRAHVDVVAQTNREKDHSFRSIRLDWDHLEDTGWTREEALTHLQPQRFPPKTPVPAGLYHWRETPLPQVLRKFLRIEPEAGSFDYAEVVSRCLGALRACRPSGQDERVGAVSSDGEPHRYLREDERWLLEDFRAKLDRDIRSRPYGDDIRRRLVLAGAWLYAGAPAAVYDDLRLAFRRCEYPRGFVQAAGRCFADEHDVRLFFKRCAEIFDQQEGTTDWAKALGQILLYREDACLWLDAERARLCLYGVRRELQRALEDPPEPRPQIFNNAILALLGLLRVRRHLPGFLFGRGDDPIPGKVGGAIRAKLKELAERLARHDQWRAERVCEVLRLVEGRGTEQLVAAHFDQ